MSIFPTKMQLLSAIVLDEVSDNVARELLNAGVMDFINVSRIIKSDDLNLRHHNEEDLAQIVDLRKKIEIIYKQADIKSPAGDELQINEMVEVHISDIQRKISEANNNIQQLREEQKKLNQEKLKKSEIIDYFKNSRNNTKNNLLIISRGKPGRGSFSEMVSKLGTIPFFGTEMPDSDNYVLITLKRDKNIITELFKKFQWIEDDQQKSSDSEYNSIILKLDKEAADIQDKIDGIKDEIKKDITAKKDDLDSLWKNLKIHELYGTIKNNFSHTRSTAVFSGWLPVKKAELAENAIKKAAGDKCVIEWSSDDQFRRNEIPVEIKHSKTLSPFQMLVENYSTPEYGTVDPTIFVAVSYLIMFGLMFGDAGQGLVIMLIGLIGRKIVKNVSPGIKKLLTLFVYCGISSVITGVLFGSYFGYPVFQPLWFDYHSVVAGHSSGAGGINSVYDILKITVLFGISVISFGLVLNWVNLYRKKDYFNLFLDKSGLIGGWFYGCGVYTSFYFVGTGYKSLPAPGLLSVFFGIPVIILFFKAPLHFILHERKHKEFNAFSIIDFIMEWVVEILEIFSGYLANTLSFLRVAGLGIAHVSLMVAFDTISGLTSGIASVIILIAGNILVIGLEGLSAGIQALRLNYYEFFSRYFTGKGIAYNPVSLRNRKQEG